MRTTPFLAPLAGLAMLCKLLQICIDSWIWHQNCLMEDHFKWAILAHVIILVPAIVVVSTIRFAVLRFERWRRRSKGLLRGPSARSASGARLVGRDEARPAFRGARVTAPPPAPTGDNGRRT